MPDDDKINILVVDDLADKRLALQAALEELGENVVTADSGREALRQLLGRDFAVILLDVNMPGMDGFETAALIRQRPRCETTPIIFVTGYGDEVLAIQGYSLGAVDYILSPVVPEVLRTKVGVFVDLYRKTQQVQRQAQQEVALAREQAARAAAEEATRRSTFLAEASHVLANSLDLPTTLRGLLRVVVPRLADLAGGTLPGERGAPWQSELAWAEPPDGFQSRSLGGLDGPQDDLRAGVERVLASGQAEVLGDLDVPYPPAALGVPAQGRVRAAVVLPLRARGRILGALTLAQGSSGRTFAPADLALAEDLAGRAAIALDNARLYQDVQEADRRKDEFLAMLAHELRNPLAPIRNALRILQATGGDTVAGRPAMEIMERQVGHMVRLIDDLLDVSRITRGKITLQPTLVRVGDVLAAAVEACAPLLEARRQRLTVDVPAAPLWVWADPTRLAQVVANLLNNAAKYTDEGGAVALRAEAHGADAVVGVRDTGVGIPAEVLPRVFDLFTQADRSIDRAQGGLGIGLTVVRRLVEMHGGSVQAQSDGPGKGSLFLVRLPLVAGPQGGSGEAPAPASGGAERPGEPGRRVLVVDDNADSADSLALLLRLRGHQVHTAHDGEQALAAAGGLRPEVVFLDIGLPRMDGYEVARRLRQDPGLNGAVLVAMTGYGQEEDRRRSQEAGFDAHLVKPVDLDALEAMLRRPG